jgi:secretion/DNA translocation related CpaE-like protein
MFDGGRVSPDHHPVTSDDVLIISNTPHLADDVRRVAAAVGISARVLPEALSAVPWWLSSAVVVLDPISLQQALQLRLPVRSRVVVVTDESHSRHLWRQALEVGSRTVLTLPDGEQWLVDALGRAGVASKSSAPVVTVLGARGGAGASVLAAVLARVAAKEALSCYLIDLDPLGCGLHTYLGTERLEGVGWADLHHAIGRIPSDLLRGGLPHVEGIRILSWLGDDAELPPVGVVGSVLDAAAMDADLVVVDLPRWLPMEQSPVTVEALTRTDQTLLVCPADIRSTFAAQRLLQSASLAGIQPHLVVRGPSPGGLVGADIADALSCPLAVEMSPERRLDQHLEDAVPPGDGRRSPLRSAAQRLLRHVSSSATR